MNSAPSNSLIFSWQTSKDWAFWLLPWLIILLGIALRLQQYSLDRSLWLDELFFATNFLERDFFQLFQLPLDYSSSHVAPPGFMLLSFIMVKLFGLSEAVLRFLPLACGIGALFLFKWLGDKILSSTARPIALFLFAVSDALIYYSAEFKQYSCDVLITLALLLWFVHLQQQPLTQRALGWLAVIGSVLIWFSHPAAFILASFGLYIGLRSLWQHDWHKIPTLLGVASLWALSFWLMYYTVGGNVKDSEIGRWLVTFWHLQQAFMPTLNHEALNWLTQRLWSVLDYPAGLTHVVVVVWFMSMGFVFFLFKKQTHIILWLVLPIAFAIIASYFEKFPFADRLILFILPSIYLLLAEGIAHLRFTSPVLEKSAWLIILNSILILSIVAYITNFPIYKKQYRQEIKPILSYIEQHKQPQDSFYIYHWAEPALRFYGKEYDFNHKECVLINEVPKQEYTREIDFYRQQKNLPVTPFQQQKCILGVASEFDLSLIDLEKIRDSGRYWFVFSHIMPSDYHRFIAYLDQHAQRLDAVLQPGSAAFLYQF